MTVHFESRRTRIRALPCLVVGLCGLTSAAVAEEQLIEEILVTAEKRESTLQETPVAITALTTDIVEDRNINDLRKVTAIAPSMVYNSANGQAQIYMRGIGTDVNTIMTEPGVAMFVDGVYMGTTSEQAATFENVERVEVLRGPQGTLYGRNSTGGNVNVITRLPGEEPEFSASLLFGDYDRMRASVSGGGSLIEGVLAARVSLVKDTADGYRENGFNGDDLEDRDIFSAALSVVFTPSETFRVDPARRLVGGKPRQPHMDLRRSRSRFRPQSGVFRRESRRHPQQATAQRSDGLQS